VFIHLSSVITSHIHQKHYSVNSVTRVVKRSSKIRSFIYNLYIYKFEFSFPVLVFTIRFVIVS